MKTKAEEQFADWLCREIPEGTIISNPSWWAPRVWNAVLRAQAAQVLEQEPVGRCVSPPCKCIGYVARVQCAYWFKPTTEGRRMSVAEAEQWLAGTDLAPTEHTAEKKIGCVQHDCDECQQQAATIKEMRELLEKIDVKAQAGLCQMTFGGAREFLKDIRLLVLERTK